MFTKRTAINRVKQFLAECRELPLAIDKAILFGSIVNGKNNEDSDIDLALFSPRFSDNILRNIDLIGKVNIRYPEIDVHTFTSGKTKEKGLLMSEILNKGIEIKV